MNLELSELEVEVLRAVFAGFDKSNNGPFGTSFLPSEFIDIEGANETYKKLKRKIRRLTIRDSPIRFVTRRVKPLSQITAGDIPPGLDAEDVATDCE